MIGLALSRTGMAPGHRESSCCSPAAPVRSQGSPRGAAAEDIEVFFVPALD
eukprot:CAMPEP_0179325710 /NCGR_PEP_ID=MMETSP0797-20121207/61040_1 /TAXON_ID=47934 /ORGANISM="Dinophysis acuminata, Strain DAEP01" /LENGTH=50 /DNA_ID=CAMNT_0021037919 /DNA_START=89 /DNA_END=241 /DNA_ORIENTATION=+